MHCRSEIRGYKTVRVERKEPCKDGGCREEELGGKGNEEGDGVEDRDDELGGVGGHLHDGEPEHGEEDVHNVDGIRPCKRVCLETGERVCG